LKRIFSGLLTLLIGILLILPASAPAQADSNTEATVKATKSQALMIKADNKAEIGQPVTITVFSRRSHETIAGATVYAIKTSDRVGPAGVGNYTIVADEFEALIESDGTLIGTTGNDGTVSAVLAEAGRYALVATKVGFLPGFARLQVREDGNKLRLNLQAPASSPAGQQVTIKVTSGTSGEPVDNATVSAIKSPNVLPRIIKPSPVPAENGTATQMISGQQAPIVIDSEQEDALAGRLGKKEIVLGSSNSSGEVTYTFNDPGMYVLLVRKPGYLPGTRRINIQSDTALKALDIKAAINLTTGQSSSIQVNDQSSGQPIEGAAVYSLKVENNMVIKQMPPTANNGKAMVNRVLNDADRVREKGVLVGNTDSAGQVAYSFPSSGQYLLAAFKEGYTAAVTRVSYFPAVSARPLTLKAPSEANVGSAVAVSVLDDNTTAISGAAVYSVRLDSIKDGQSLLRLLPGITADVKQKYTSLLKDKSSLSGFTDVNGQATINFARPGLFLLLAVKDGFIPDFARINILQVPTVTTVPESTTTTTTTQ